MTTSASMQIEPNSGSGAVLFTFGGFRLNKSCNLGPLSDLHWESLNIRVIESKLPYNVNIIIPNSYIFYVGIINYGIICHTGGSSESLLSKKAAATINKFDGNVASSIRNTSVTSTIQKWPTLDMAEATTLDFEKLQYGGLQKRTNA